MNRQVNGDRRHDRLNVLARSHCHPDDRHVDCTDIEAQTITQIILLMCDAVRDVLLDIGNAYARILRVLLEHIIQQAVHVDRFSAEFVNNLEPTERITVLVFAVNPDVLAIWPEKIVDALLQHVKGHSRCRDDRGRYTLAKIRVDGFPFQRPTADVAAGVPGFVEGSQAHRKTQHAVSGGGNRGPVGIPYLQFGCVTDLTVGQSHLRDELTDSKEIEGENVLDRGATKAVHK